MSRPRVVLGMSGGVDSSVSAALLVEQGFDVIGVAMRLWGEESESGCCSFDDFLDARRVAGRLGIPFFVMDFQREFRSAVVEPFAAEYKRGRTPNPCARCNQFLKFGALWDRARELGAEWIATGHYAQVVHPVGGQSELWRSQDAGKDQSYYLFAIPPDVLNHCLFPLGDLTKAQVRDLARRLDLPVADKPDSQEICFVPKGGHADFVERLSTEPLTKPGKIVDDAGRVLGLHEGIHRFTVGQRRGLGVSTGEALYVTEIDARSAQVRVGPREATLSGGLIANDVHWLSAPPAVGARVSVKIRARFAAVPALVMSSSPEAFVLRVDQGLPAVTPGQAAVVYEGGRVLGGGWIERGTPRVEVSE